jgi:hypothetical protein
MPQDPTKAKVTCCGLLSLETDVGIDYRTPSESSTRRYRIVHDVSHQIFTILHMTRKYTLLPWSTECDMKDDTLLTGLLDVTSLLTYLKHWSAMSCFIPIKCCLQTEKHSQLSKCGAKKTMVINRTIRGAVWSSG